MKRIELKNGNYKIIQYYDTEETKIQSKQYYNSKYYFHRVDGPAIIWYYESGEIQYEDYLVNGKEYSKEEFEKKINIERNLKLLNKK